MCARSRPWSGSCGGSRRSQYAPTMAISTQGDPMHRLSSTTAIGLVAIQCLVALGCSDGVNPLTPRIPSLTAAAALASVKGEGEDHRGTPIDVHAIHVAITSMSVGTTTVDRYSFHARRKGD